MNQKKFLLLAIVLCASVEAEDDIKRPNPIIEFFEAPLKALRAKPGEGAAGFQPPVVNASNAAGNWFQRLSNRGKPETTTTPTPTTTTTTTPTPPPQIIIHQLPPQNNMAGNQMSQINNTETQRLNQNAHVVRTGANNRFRNQLARRKQLQRLQNNQQLQNVNRKRFTNLNNGQVQSNGNRFVTRRRNPFVNNINNNVNNRRRTPDRFEDDDDDDDEQYYGDDSSDENDGGNRYDDGDEDFDDDGYDDDENDTDDEAEEFLLQQQQIYADRRKGSRQPNNVIHLNPGQPIGSIQNPMVNMIPQSQLQQTTYDLSGGPYFILQSQGENQLPILVPVKIQSNQLHFGGQQVSGNPQTVSYIPIPLQPFGGQPANVQSTPFQQMIPQQQIQFQNFQPPKQQSPPMLKPQQVIIGPPLIDQLNKSKPQMQQNVNLNPSPQNNKKKPNRRDNKTPVNSQLNQPSIQNETGKDKFRPNRRKPIVRNRNSQRGHKGEQHKLTIQANHDQQQQMHVEQDAMGAVGFDQQQPTKSATFPVDGKSLEGRQKYFFPQHFYPIGGSGYVEVSNNGRFLLKTGRTLRFEDLDDEGDEANGDVKNVVVDERIDHDVEESEYETKSGVVSLDSAVGDEETVEGNEKASEKADGVNILKVEQNPIVVSNEKPSPVVKVEGEIKSEIIQKPVIADVEAFAKTGASENPTVAVKEEAAGAIPESSLLHVGSAVEAGPAAKSEPAVPAVSAVLESAVLAESAEQLKSDIPVPVVAEPVQTIYEPKKDDTLQPAVEVVSSSKVVQPAKTASVSIAQAPVVAQSVVTVEAIPAILKTEIHSVPVVAQSASLPLVEDTQPSIADTLVPAKPDTVPKTVVKSEVVSEKANGHFLVKQSVHKAETPVGSVKIETAARNLRVNRGSQRFHTYRDVGV